MTYHERRGDIGTLKLTYLLMLGGILTGVSAFAGLILAYVMRDDSPPWMRRHYDNLITTFWIGFVLLIVFSVLAVILIGIPMLLLLGLWWIVSLAKGLRSVMRRDEGWADYGY